MAQQSWLPLAGVPDGELSVHPAAGECLVLPLATLPQQSTKKCRAPCFVLPGQEGPAGPGKSPGVNKSLKRTALAWLLPFHAEVLASAADFKSCLPAVPSGELFACLHLDPGMALLLGRLCGVAKPVLLLPSGAERGRAGGSAMVSFYTCFFLQ